MSLNVNKTKGVIMKITLSKSQWEKIGKGNGWTKQSQIEPQWTPEERNWIKTNEFKLLNFLQKYRSIATVNDAEIEKLILYLKTIKE